MERRLWTWEPRKEATGTEHHRPHPWPSALRPSALSTSLPLVPRRTSDLGLPRPHTFSIPTSCCPSCPRRRGPLHPSARRRPHGRAWQEAKAARVPLGPARTLVVPLAAPGSSAAAAGNRSKVSALTMGRSAPRPPQKEALRCRAYPTQSRHGFVHFRTEELLRICWATCSPLVPRRTSTCSWAPRTMACNPERCLRRRSGGHPTRRRCSCPRRTSSSSTTRAALTFTAPGILPVLVGRQRFPARWEAAPRGSGLGVVCHRRPLVDLPERLPRGGRP